MFSRINRSPDSNSSGELKSSDALPKITNGSTFYAELAKGYIEKLSSNNDGQFLVGADGILGLIGKIREEAKKSPEAQKRLISGYFDEAITPLAAAIKGQRSDVVTSNAFRILRILDYFDRDLIQPARDGLKKEIIPTEIFGQNLKLAAARYLSEICLPILIKEEQALAKGLARDFAMGLNPKNSWSVRSICVDALVQMAKVTGDLPVEIRTSAVDAALQMALDANDLSKPLDRLILARSMRDLYSTVAPATAASELNAAKERAIANGRNKSAVNGIIKIVLDALPSDTSK